jgi:hypothetical protein
LGEVLRGSGTGFAKSNSYGNVSGSPTSEKHGIVPWHDETAEALVLDGIPCRVEGKIFPKCCCIEKVRWYDSRSVSSEVLENGKLTLEF